MYEKLISLQIFFMEKWFLKQKKFRISCFEIYNFALVAGKGMCAA